jgi:hypothetical protein
MITAPKWFRSVISEGLIRLVALSLPGQPSHETVALTKEAWIESLWPRRGWVEADAARISEAFRALMAHTDRWPAPRVLIEYLPARPEPRKLPAPGPSKKQRQANLRRLKAIRRSLVASTRMPN